SRPGHRVRRSALVGALAVACVAGVAASTAQARPLGPDTGEAPSVESAGAAPEGGLAAIAAPDMIVGAHSNPSNLANADGPIVEREANLLSTHQHWVGSWTGPKTFDATKIDEHDAMVDWADEKGMQVHAWLPFGAAHYSPKWLQGSPSAADVEGHMTDAVQKITSSAGNAEQVDYWTVVNEPFANRSGKYVETHWNAMGTEPDKSGLTGDQAPLTEHPAYIRKAFEQAAQAAPNAKLGLRENNMEFSGQGNYQSTYQLAVHLLKSGVKLDVIEFQSHMNAYPAGQVPAEYSGPQNQDGTYNWDAFKENVRRYQELGLEVHLGEVDFYTQGYEAGSKEAREAQRVAAQGLMTAAREVGVDVFTLWGLREDSMDPQSNEHKAQPFEADGTPKPAYDGLRQALTDTEGSGGEGGTPSPSPSPTGSPSPSPTSSETPTGSPSPTPTESETATATPTVSETSAG
ncbi:MAG: endo-1,4-beta-xylanase, partial [Dermatophilaceae bacterium]